MTSKPATFDPDRLRRKRVTVMGLGSFGGGVGVVRFLARHGAVVRVSDQRSRQQLADSVAALADVSRIDWRLGGHDWSHFADAELVVLNPAVRPDHPLVRQLVHCGVPLTTEMNLFWQCNRGRVIGVTGSNGKSTTAALIHALLEASGQRCWLGGNIGRSLLPVADQIAPSDLVVLELSSFQLERLDWLQARPDIAVVTSFAPNHLDWHGSLDAYAQAKQSLLRWQTSDDWAVLNVRDGIAADWPGSASRVIFDVQRSGSRAVSDPQPGGTEPDNALSENRPTGSALVGHSDAARCRSAAAGMVWLDGDRIRYRIDARACSGTAAGTGVSVRAGSPVATVSGVGNSASGRTVSLSGFRLRGRHNRENALAAVAAAAIAGADAAAIERGLARFQPLPHRLQPIGQFRGRTFYDDSIATTPESAMAALDALAEPIVLLAGGYDKQVDLKAFARAIGRRVKAAALLGATAPRLSELLRQEPSPPSQQIAVSLRDAVCWALDQSAPGDVVLLSPGCASYDWFENFEDRGRQFAAIVQALAGPAASGKRSVSG